MATYGDIGSVSSGTLLAEDLIPAFADALDNIKDSLQTSITTTTSAEETEDIKRQVSEIDNLLAEIEQRQQAEDYYESEDAGHDIEALTDKLNEYAAPFCHFGAHEGDGADFGFWFDNDSFDEACHAGEVLKIDAGDEWPESLDDDVQYVAEITDHGNLTLYSRDHVEIFSIV